MRLYRPQRHMTRWIETLPNRTYGQLFSLWVGAVLMFAIIYWLLATIGDIQHHGPTQLVAMTDPIARFWNAIYFSTITATTVGYGDITPVGFSKAIAACQSITALSLFGIFITKLVSHRQEIALQEVHRLSFEEVFHNVREGLFIIRKDFDHLIAIANENRTFDEEDWDDLIVAYKQGQSLITDIPGFYDQENDLYMLDVRREQLLQEAVHRTLHRINTLLDTLSEHSVVWTEHAASMNELRELVRVIGEMTPLWRTRSPYDRAEAFQDILRLRDNIEVKIEKAMRE